eukprot:SAG31_NODE_2154_length_6312_cov_3.684050_5_plen_176_part_00
MDAQGMFRITGRYKELIIGAGGENVAPVPMEDYLKTNFPAICDAMMVGDKRKYNIVLISVAPSGDMPAIDELGAVINGGQNKAGVEIDPIVKTISEAMEAGKDQTSAWHKYISGAIKAANSDPDACPSNAAKIQKFAIIPTNFSVDAEDLTPTLKLKRSVVEKKYTAIIDELYGP